MQSVALNVIKQWFPSVLAAVFLAMFAPFVHAQSNEVIGVVHFVRGDGSQIDSQGRESKLRSGSEIFSGADLAVRGEGYLLIRIFDGARFRLGYNGRAFVSGTLSSEGKLELIELKVPVGDFSYKGRDNHLELGTPTANVRSLRQGGEFEGKVERNGTTTVLNKRGWFQVLDINGEKQIELVHPGDRVEVSMMGGFKSTSGPEPDRTPL